jgi:hypothetical protein
LYLSQRISMPTLTESKNLLASSYLSFEINFGALGRT